MLLTEGTVSSSPSSQSRLDVQRRSAPEAESEQRLVDDLVHHEAASERRIRSEFLVELSDGIVTLHGGRRIVDALVTESYSRLVEFRPRIRSIED